MKRKKNLFLTYKSTESWRRKTHQYKIYVHTVQSVPGLIHISFCVFYVIFFLILMEKYVRWEIKRKEEKH
jgi:hypothetical protein